MRVVKSAPLAVADAAAAASIPSSLRLSEVAHLRDPWETSVYEGLCVGERRWLLHVQQRPGLPPPKAFGSGAFQRYPLRALVVGNRTEALRQRSSARCWRDGATFVADLRHEGATMGIAHFAKRILRLHGLQRQAAAYGLPAVTRVVFPATSARHLGHSWPRAMLALVAPAAEAVPSGRLMAEQCCFATVVASARENTYFTRPADADALRAAAHARAGVPAARPACAPLCACYFRRSEGKPGGLWEGGARLVANRPEVLARMARLVAAAAPGGIVRVVNANSSHTFEQQVAPSHACPIWQLTLPAPAPPGNSHAPERQVAIFAACDLLVSVHGSHNANLMWMRPGSAMMEVNPHKFFYSSYQHLAAVSSVLFLSSRRNSIDITGRESKAQARKVAGFNAKFGHTTDDVCQQISSCRSLSRNFPTRVNLTDFDAEFARGLRHVAPTVAPGPGCPPPAPSALGVPLVDDAAPAPLAAGGRRALRRGAGRALRGRGGRGRGFGRGARAAAQGDARGGAGPPAASAAPVAAGALRVAVCVGGQLSRLEVTSKVENVLKSTAAARPAALDLFLALEVGTHLYSNLDLGAIFAQQHGCGAASRTADLSTAHPALPAPEG